MTREDKLLFNDLLNNKKLYSFCKELLTLNFILNNKQTRPLYLAVLISADALIDKQSYEEHLETCKFIKNYIHLMQFDDSNDEAKIIEYIDNALNTLQTEFYENYSSI